TMARRHQRIFANPPPHNPNNEVDPSIDIEFTVISSPPAVGLPGVNASLVLEDLQHEAGQ
ncbi:hypothetical protein BGX21_003780, partial [Mortierella sp. AD011]